MVSSTEYPDLVIVGAGLFGLTVAQQAVEHTGARVHIIDIRDHIGQNISFTIKTVKDVFNYREKKGNL